MNSLLGSPSYHSPRNFMHLFVPAAVPMVEISNGIGPLYWLDQLLACNDGSFWYGVDRGEGLSKACTRAAGGGTGPRISGQSLTAAHAWISMLFSSIMTSSKRREELGRKAPENMVRYSTQLLQYSLLSNILFMLELCCPRWWLWVYFLPFGPVISILCCKQSIRYDVHHSV